MFVAENATSTGVDFSVQFKFSGGDTILYSGMTNVLSSTTPQRHILEYIRYLEDRMKLEKRGVTSGSINTEFPLTNISNLTYNNKIVMAKLYTSANSKFTGGTFKLYGKRKF